MYFESLMNPDRPIVETHRAIVLEDARHVHAAACGTEVDEVLDKFRLLQECTAPLIVDRASPADVPRQVSVANERGEHALGQQRCVTIRYVLGVDERTDEPLGHDRVRDTQPGKQDLVEAADINDTAVRIHALQRGDRPAFVAIVAVVVVFENIRLLLSGPVE
jgi:hypothetical protein